MFKRNGHVLRSVVGASVVLGGAVLATAAAGDAHPPSSVMTASPESGNQHELFPCGKARAMAERFRAGLEADLASRSSFEAMADTDVLHYDLDIEVFNIGTGNVTITGSNRITIRSLSSALTEFTFRLRDTFAITGAYVNDTTPVTVTTASVTTRIAELDRTYGVDEEFTLTIEYNGTIMGGYVWVASTQTGVPLIASLSAAYGAFTWWPSKDGDYEELGDNSDKATAEFSITVPDNFQVPSNGLLQSIDTLSGGRLRYNWLSNYPAVTYNVSFAVCEYNQWTEYYDHDAGSMPVEFYISEASDNTYNRSIWNLVVNMLPVYADLFGEYPFIDEKYGIYEAPWTGGMEHQTMTGQGGSWGFQEWLCAHELAHSWWGNMITCKTWSDIWINEGFATYAEAMWWEFQGANPRPDRLLAVMHDYKPPGAGAGDSVYVYPEDLSEFRIFSHDYSYHKGAWVLHQLRHIVGDGVFFAMLADFRDAFAYSAASTEDFIDVAENAYGQDLQWFFDQWVYNAGAPAYAYGWETENVGGQDYLRVRIVQTQQPPNPEVFIMPVDLVATIDGVPETLTVWNDARQQWYELPVSGPVTALQFDPDEWILRNDAIEVGYSASSPGVPPSPHNARKNRYISFDPNNTENVAFQVEMTASAEFAGSVGILGWVGEPGINQVSRVVSGPYFTETWPAIVQVADCEIVPAATFAIRATLEGLLFSDPLEIGTILKPGALYYGDTVGQGTGDLPPLPGYTPPNGVVNVSDVQAYILTVQGPSSPSVHTTWVDLHGDGDGAPPNFVVNVSDLQRIKFGFQGQTYAQSPDQIDPAECP